MKTFSKVVESNEDIQGKIDNVKDELNIIKDLEVQMNHIESGNGVIIKIEFSLTGNLKTLSTKALTTILDKLNGYIEGINYEDKKNKMIVLFKTFSHNL